MAVDRAGWIYKAAAGGYGGPGDTNAGGAVTFNYFNRETLEWGDDEAGAYGSIEIPRPEGDAMWPWVAAGDDGRAAVVWYQNIKDMDGDGTADENWNKRFYAFAAYTTNAHGSEVTCSDGSTQWVEPQFSVVNASGRPIH